MNWKPTPNQFRRLERHMRIGPKQCPELKCPKCGDVYFRVLSKEVTKSCHCSPDKPIPILEWRECADEFVQGIINFIFDEPHTVNHPSLKDENNEAT